MNIRKELCLNSQNVAGLSVVISGFGWGSVVRKARDWRKRTTSLSSAWDLHPSRGWGCNSATPHRSHLVQGNSLKTFPFANDQFFDQSSFRCLIEELFSSSFMELVKSSQLFLHIFYERLFISKADACIPHVGHPRLVGILFILLNNANPSLKAVPNMSPTPLAVLFFHVSLGRPSQFLSLCSLSHLFVLSLPVGSQLYCKGSSQLSDFLLYLYPQTSVLFFGTFIFLSHLCQYCSSSLAPLVWLFSLAFAFDVYLFFP